MDNEIARLEQELRDAKKRASDEMAARKAEVEKVYRYTLSIDTKPYDVMLDDTVLKYRLEGEIVNLDQCIEAGYSESELKVGGHTYLFNTLSSRFICGIGGGYVYLGFDRDEGTRERFERLAEWVVDNPEGGDVTDLVNELRKGMKKF